MEKIKKSYIKVEKEIKKDAQKILDTLEIPMDVAVTLFLKEVIEEKKLPFEVLVRDKSVDTKRDFENLRFENF